MKYIDKIKRNQKSVQSIHSCKSVIQTNYDIIKAHGGERKVESPSSLPDKQVAEAAEHAGKEGVGLSAVQAGSKFTIQLPSKSIG